MRGRYVRRSDKQKRAEHFFRNCTVTTEANEWESRIHPHMPVIIYARAYDGWLNRKETEQLLLDLLRPHKSDEMKVDEANPKVKVRGITVQN